MSTTSVSHHPLRIFIVEDHADTAKYLRMYLEGAGHHVSEARTLATALIAIPDAGCDVLISDIGLSDGTGWQLLQSLREGGLPYPSYAIAMSGYGSTSDKLKSESAGYRHHVLKPVDLDEMDALLAEAGSETAGRSPA